MRDLAISTYLTFVHPLKIHAKGTLASSEQFSVAKQSHNIVEARGGGGAAADRGTAASAASVRRRASSHVTRGISPDQGDAIKAREVIPDK